MSAADGKAANEAAEVKDNNRHTPKAIIMYTRKGNK
jgi:hypothetical protein